MRCARDAAGRIVPPPPDEPLSAGGGMMGRSQPPRPGRPENHRPGGQSIVRDGPRMKHPLLPSAIRTVSHCCRTARSVQHDHGSLDHIRRITKDDRSPVTVADFAVQAIVAMDLQEQDE